jgi:hypothetical protein
MPAPKPATKPLKAKSFEAVLERTADRLRWVIARVPFDAAKLWGKRGQIKMQGEINGFPFGATFFPMAKAVTFSSSTRSCFPAERPQQD